MRPVVVVVVVLLLVSVTANEAGGVNTGSCGKGKILS